MIKRIAAIGGDSRTIYLIEILKNKGYSVENFVSGGDFDVVKNCDAVILPMPLSRDGVTVNAPLSKEPILMKEIASLCGNRPAFGGYFGKTASLFQNPFDYGVRDETAIPNAVATAEGAISIAIEKLPITVFGMKCLVTGYGKVAKCLSERLKALFADVTVAARKQKDLLWAKERGFRPLPFSKLSESLSEFDCIFNTVPEKVFGEKELANVRKDVYIIELASSPGGVDKEAAARHNVNVISAPSLPGKTAPKTSAEIIFNCIEGIISEEKL